MTALLTIYINLYNRLLLNDLMVGYLLLAGK